MSNETERAVFDNREAMAYLLFRRFRCSRDEALAAVDELGEVFRGVRKVAAGQWRHRRRPKPATPETTTTKGTP